MPLPSHLEIYNFNRIGHNENIFFHQFTFLPKELRLQIWQYALRRNRIISLLLCPPNVNDKWARRQSVRSDGDISSYDIIVNGTRILSKFLRINKESRDEALRFYRVHLPCNFAHRDLNRGSISPAILHFNPEHDFLRLRNVAEMGDQIAHFLSSMKTHYDSRHVGVLNLALDRDSQLGALRRLNLSMLNPEARSAFLETIAQLQQVFFVCTQRIGRQNCTPVNNLRRDDPFFCRSFPILASTPSFERFDRDPRPIRRDLTRIFTGTLDSRSMPQTWFELLKKWDVVPGQALYRYLFAFEPCGPPLISDRNSAEQWLQQEDDKWLHPNKYNRPDFRLHWARRKKLKQPYDDIPGECHLEDPERSVRPAFGFWLFPLEAMGPLREQGVPESTGFRYSSKTVYDFSQHWPELALAGSV